METAQFDAYMKLADFRLKRVEARRDNEWKISIGLWGVLAAAPLYVRDRPNDLILALTLAFVALFYAIAWVGQFYSRSKQDTDTMFYYIERAEIILGERATQPRPRPGAIKDIHWQDLWFGFARDPHNWSGWFQIGTTIVLAITAYLLIGRLPHPAS